METCSITTENIYNFDEKGFLIGLGSATKHIMVRAALKSGQILGASQDGSREFISLLACICADSTYLPPTLIYEGKLHGLQDSWLRGFGESDIAYFGALNSGWSSDVLGLQWLKRVFDRHIKQKASQSRRLLLVDGHSSHVNMKSLDSAEKR